ncbi:BNR repeat-containing protein [Alcanivorax hongdengensis A-11-3]|uniref:BNR repeat-containing protein n=2 Tax=Alcanivorax hongdengensis TaxID=519051 RepID=L0WGJ5_9GAMM|nr:BNR repeat-containing protein [Alcanivorax hongdengensis A-11-3]
MAVMATLAGSVQASEFLDNNAPLVRANTYLGLAYAGERAVAVGDRGKIIYSDDQGSHWKVAATPTQVLLTAVCFADPRHGWAVGHDAVVLGTDDGGETWTLEYSDPLGGEGDQQDDTAYDDSGDMGDIYGDPYGDDSYDEPAPVDTSGAPLLDVYCEGRDRAVAVGGYGYFLETQDGGQNWKKDLKRLDNVDGWHLYSYNGKAGLDERYVTGEKGVIFRSRDRGKTWKKLDSPYQGTLFGATLLSDYQALVYGLQGNVWLTGNRGNSWTHIDTGLSRGINAGTVLKDGTVVLVTNAGGILTSHDGGQSLSLRFLPGRESISAVLPRSQGGVLIAGQGGVRVVEDVK